MTQFKVGDRVKLAKVGGSIPNSFGYKIGDTATILDVSDIMSIVIEMDNGPKGGRQLLICSHEIEAASPTTPTETIQHEGYNYTRGKPVVPEWVKDGAWVVDTVHGRVLQMRSHGFDEVFVVIPEQRTKHAMISGKDFPTGLKYVPLYNLTPTTAP